MKKYQILLAISIILMLSMPAFADYYVVDINNKVVAKTRYQPNQADLDTRNEIAVYSDKDFDLLEAEYRNGKIVKHTKTKDELGAEAKIKDKHDEMSLIRRKLNHMACLALEEAGITFKEIKCSDFE